MHRPKNGSAPSSWASLAAGKGRNTHECPHGLPSEPPQGKTQAQMTWWACNTQRTNDCHPPSRPGPDRFWSTTRLFRLCKGTPRLASARPATSNPRTQRNRAMIVRASNWGVSRRTTAVHPTAGIEPHSPTFLDATPCSGSSTAGLRDDFPSSGSETLAGLRGIAHSEFECAPSRLAGGPVHAERVSALPPSTIHHFCSLEFTHPFRRTLAGPQRILAHESSVGRPDPTRTAESPPVGCEFTF